MPRDGSYISVVASPFVSLWNVLHFVFVTLLWSNLFGTKKRKVARSAAQGSRRRIMASKTPPKPCKTQNSLDETDDDLPMEIVNLRAHHKQAYSYIAKALEIDEEGGLID